MCICGRDINSNEMLITFESEPDRLGRRQFFLEWLQDSLVGMDFPLKDGRRCPHRGQIFMAVPEPYIEQAAKDGKVVVIKDKFAERDASFAWLKAQST